MMQCDLRVCPSFGSLREDRQICAYYGDVENCPLLKRLSKAEESKRTEGFEHFKVVEKDNGKFMIVPKNEVIPIHPIGDDLPKNIAVAAAALNDIVVSICGSPQKEDK